MKQLVEYELEDDKTITIEVDLPPAGLERAARGDQIVKAKERFTDALEQITPVAQTVISKFRDLSADEIEVEFGIKLSAQAGVVIASADTEANFTVKLTWRRHESQQQPLAAPQSSPPTSNEA